MAHSPKNGAEDPATTLPASVDPLQLEAEDRDSSVPPSSEPLLRAGWIPTPSRSIPAPPPVPLDTAAPTPGTVLGGKYRIERVLGSGGIAVVAAAYHLQLRRRVAIKYLLVEALEYPEIVERFTREARAAARIRGEHVARVIDVGVFDGGAPYIVLEYLDGMDLDEYLKHRGPLSITRAVRYILQTCEALAEAHAAKIVHRDLKPANLFLAKSPDRQKVIKVLDFGVSKIVDEPMTDQSRMLGTVMYMSPEQLRAACEVDLRTDIWSLGVILYELLAGVAPFNGKTIVSVAKAVGQNKPRPVSELRPDVPERLEAVIAKCMRTDPADRYASVLELAVALAPFAKSRDRESVRTITGVLQGSLVPPPRESNHAFDSGDIVPLPPPPYLTVPPSPTLPSVLPSILPPPSIGSDAPMITPVDSSDQRPIVSSAPVGPSALRARAAWLFAAAAVVAAAVAIGAGGLALGSRQAAQDRTVAPPTDITLRITSRTPNARVRIDDGPLRPLPLETSVPRDQREHTIHVEADGFTPQTSKVSFASDLVYSTSLSPRTDEPPP